MYSNGSHIFSMDGVAQDSAGRFIAWKPRILLLKKEQKILIFAKKKLWKMADLLDL